MRNVSRIFLIYAIVVLLSFLFFSDSLAKTDLSITATDITFSKEKPLEGETIRIFARVFNLGDRDVYGFVLFLINGKEMTDPQPISVKINTYDDVFIDYVFTPGTYNIQAKIIGTNPQDENPADDSSVRENYFVDSDTDGDKIGNTKDLDDDNDGLSDEKEVILGTNPLMPDTDGDGVGDKEDIFPLDSAETKDNDGDGIGNNADTDDDNDGLTDEEEKIIGTDSFNHDTDRDGFNDKDDALPLDSKEWQDSDKDGIGDNEDTDDDNDGLSDEEELFVFGTNPSNPDTDEDGISDKKEIDLGTNPQVINKKELGWLNWNLASIIQAVGGEVEGGNAAVLGLFSAFGYLSIILLILEFLEKRKSSRE